MKGCRDLLFSIIEKTSCGVLGFLLTPKFNSNEKHSNIQLTTFSDKLNLKLLIISSIEQSKLIMIELIYS